MARKPKSSNVSVLATKIAKVTNVRERRTLGQAQKKRAEKLREIAKRLQAREHIQNRMLETWLTPNEYESIEISWQSELECRNALGEKPQGVVNYENLLRKADFEWAKSEGYAGKRNNKQAAAFLSKSESAYERALEHLDEQLSLHPELIAWFDCEMDFATFRLDGDSVPRCITSRRFRTQGSSTNNNQSKCDIKLAVVKKAIDDLIFEPVVTAPSSSKLHNLITLSKDDLDF
jgi:hypothetical protein